MLPALTTLPLSLFLPLWALSLQVSHPTLPATTPIYLQVFPTRVRTTGVGVVTSCARLGGAVAPALVAAVGSRPEVALVVCGGVAAVCALLAAKFPLETANVSLADAAGAGLGPDCRTPSPHASTASSQATTGTA